MMKLLIFYVHAVFIGICVMLIPASSFLFDGSEGYALTSEHYGMIFIPLVAAAILSSFYYDRLAAKFGHRRLFCGGFFAFFLFLASLLFSSILSPSSPLVFPALVLAYLSLGLGFGGSLPALNLLAGDVVPRFRTGIIAGLNGCIGAGAAASPWIVNHFHRTGVWHHSLFLCGLGFGITLLATLILLRPEAFTVAASDPQKRLPFTRLPRLAYLFILTMVLYGTIETLIANWTQLFLTSGKSYAQETAAAALSLFWLSLTVGRFLVLILSIRINERTLVRTLPVLMIAGLAMIFFNESEAAILRGYIVLGLGCSCVFPVLVGILIGRFNTLGDQMAGLMVMSLMTGIGLGSILPGALEERGIITFNELFFSAIPLSVILIFMIVTITKKSHDGAPA